MTSGQRVAELFEAQYGGLEVTVLGGVLEGKIRFGVGPSDAVWRDRQGVQMFRCASHPTLQCTIVSAVDGRLGCSWSREFTPLFDSVEVFLRDAAMWRVLQGWTYVAVGALDPARAADLGLSPEGPGKGISWWTSPDVVMVAHPYLNPARSPDPQVFVLARNETVKDRVRTRLAASGVGELPFRTGDIFGSIDWLE